MNFRQVMHKNIFKKNVLNCTEHQNKINIKQKKTSVSKCLEAYIWIITESHNIIKLVYNMLI